jgi:hypothetical protein
MISVPCTVDHGKGKYVVGAIHTKTIEGLWSLIKRQQKVPAAVTRRD